MPSADPELSLRIVVRRPPRGVEFAVQRGASALLPPSNATPDSLHFDFTVRLGATADGNAPRFLGEYTQGPASARFVYVNSGRRAGQRSSAWDRRAKIPLTGITTTLIEDALKMREPRLATEIEGAAPDGGPVFASVKSAVWRAL